MRLVTDGGVRSRLIANGYDTARRFTLEAQAGKMLAEVSARLPVQLKQPRGGRAVDPGPNLLRAAVAERRRRRARGGSHSQSPLCRSMGTVDVPVQQDGSVSGRGRSVDRARQRQRRSGDGRSGEACARYIRADAAAGRGVVPELLFGADGGPRGGGWRASGVQPADADVGVSRGRRLSMAPRLAPRGVQSGDANAAMPRPT